MKRVRKEKGYLVLLALSLFLIEETVRIGLSSVLFVERDIDSMKKSLVLNPGDAEISFRLARVYHMLMLVDEKKAEALYVKSLELNPLLSSSWLGLAELFTDNGERLKALTVLNRVEELAPLYIARLWETSILALRLGAQSMAIKNLRIVAKVDPQRRMRVFDVCWQLFNDPDLILNEVIADEVLPDYLRYLITRNKPEDTFPVWKRMEKSGMVSDDIAFNYIEFLIRKDRSAEAFSIWDELFGGSKNDSLFWNGGFENEPLGRGFDWQIGKVDGVSIDFDWRKKFKGTKSLRLEFDGKHNVDFSHVSQVIPIEPDRDYLLTSYIATQGITTRNGISWDVYCYPKGNMTKSTEPLTETTDWKRVELPFHTPSDCKSVVVRLRRYKSEKLDRYISGTAWVDDVKLLKVETNTNAESREKGI